METEKAETGHGQGRACTWGARRPRERRNAMRPSKLWLGLGAILALALIGCAATMHEAEPGKPLALGEDTALVFGRIAVAENSRPVALGGIFELPAEANIIHLDGVAEDISVSLEDDGGFYLVVPRGTYLVTAVAGRFDPKTALTSPAPAAALSSEVPPCSQASAPPRR